MPASRRHDQSLRAVRIAWDEGWLWRLGSMSWHLLLTPLDHLFAYPAGIATGRRHLSAHLVGSLQGVSTRAPPPEGLLLEVCLLPGWQLM